MPRAFVMVTPFNKLVQYVHDNKEISCFACWKIGFKYLPQMQMNNIDQVSFYIMHLYMYS